MQSAFSCSKLHVYMGKINHVSFINFLMMPVKILVNYCFCSSTPELVGCLTGLGDALGQLENEVNPLLNRVCTGLI